MEVLIGAGGWSYFQAEGLDPLKAYARAFSFVEVNSTFYSIPAMRQVFSWRRSVPPGFEFSVRCHRDLTHTFHLEPVKESYRILEMMLLICRALRAKLLLLQTPRSLELTPQKIGSIRALLGSYDLRDVALAWEIRRTPSTVNRSVENLMRDLNITHCVDLSKEEPAYTTDILYSRLFGKGPHTIYQFDDEELKTIEEKTADGDHKKAVLSFHGVRMYKDAARLKMYRQTGEFPAVTNSVGLDSLVEVLREDAVFPMTKEELIQHQGWKVIDLTSAKRIRAHRILERLPPRRYSTLNEVVTQLSTHPSHKAPDVRSARGGE